MLETLKENSEMFSPLVISIAIFDPVGTLRVVSWLLDMALLLLFSHAGMFVVSDGQVTLYVNVGVIVLCAFGDRASSDIVI